MVIETQIAPAVQPSGEALPLRGRTLVTVLAGTLALLVIWFSPLPMAAPAKHALAITSMMIIFWIGEVLPHAFTGLLGCWLFWAFDIVPVRVAFGGFVNESVWFLFGVMLLGAMVVETGLAKRLALILISNVGAAWSQVLLAFVLTDFILTFLVPAGPPRVILLGSIAIGFLSMYGLDKRSNMVRAVVLAITFSATLFDKSVLASTPSILARALMTEFGGVSISWSEWFIAYLPLDAINVVAVWWAVRRFYPPEMKELTGGKQFLREQRAALGSWTASEKRAGLLAFTAVLLWATDFIHHVSPAMIGLGVGLAAVCPGIGVIGVDSARRINFLIVIFMGTTLSMAETLRETQALNVMSASAFAAVAPFMQGIVQSTVVLYVTAFIAHLVFASETSMVAITMPLVMQFALQNNLDPLALGLTWSFATGAKLFVYQSLVLIAGYSLGAFTSKDVFKLGLFFLVLELVVLVFLAPLWWPLIGIG